MHASLGIGKYFDPPPLTPEVTFYLGATAKNMAAVLFRKSRRVASKLSLENVTKVCLIFALPSMFLMIWQI